MRLSETVICDIDGVLSKHSWRDHLAKAGTYEEYHRMSAYDLPYWPMIRLIRLYEKSGCTIHLITGRMECTRLVTLNWLRKHEVPCDHLYMRPDKHTGSSVDLKKNIVHDYKLLNSLIAFDDKSDIVLSYLQLGIPAVLINQES